MKYIILVLLVVLIFLLARSFYVEDQLNSIIKQLTDINAKKSDKKITIGLLNKKIEILSQRINEIIQAKKQNEADKIKLENDLRRTIANMSHDLRTPLTSIIGYIQFLKMDKLSQKEKREYIDTAEQRAKALESLLNDFYELSLLDSMDYKLELKRLNINKTVQEVILGKYSDFMMRNIKPDIAVPHNNVYIIADEKSLERVIENLLTNAIRYAKDKIEICLEEEKDTVLLKVSNTFNNLTSEDVKNIFDRFYMADKARSGKGTGLGLSIAKGLILKMDGDIFADITDNMFSICCRFKKIT